jgi:glycosyltransferase involved in cell wall biosynthesis
MSAPYSDVGEQDNDMVLSVVIICKNEERFISRCIESVLNATARIKRKEVIVVDSCSKDRTIQTAMMYPVTILQLRPEWIHTPSAGRYIGCLNSSGNYIFFIDGDSVLIDGFIEKAMEYIDRHDRIAAVTGKRNEACHSANGSVLHRKDIHQIGDNAEPVDIARCSSLFKRSALRSAGGFNPYIYSEEEAELSDRLRRAGYLIMGIPVDMVIHNIMVRGDTLAGLARRIKNRFHLGPGQIMRYRICSGMSKELFRRISGGILPLGWLVAGLATGILAMASGNAIFFHIWLFLSCFLTIIIVLKAGTLTKAIENIASWIVYAYSFVLGFMIRPKKPDTYPSDPLRIK